MESKLYNAVKNDGSDVLKEMAADTTLSVDHQLTPTNNTVLHLACQYGSMKCVKEILSVHESLLLNINSRGETALHLAARFGHYDVVVQLIAAAKSSQTLIRTQDVELETALHAAIRFNHRTVVELLVKEDPSHEHPQNMYEETPVYLATTRGYTDIIKTILNYCEFPTFGGPDGRTALHAAVLDRDGESMKLLLNERKDLMKVADNYGWTVYHYAAYNDLYTVVTDLASVDVSVGYQLDNEHKRTPLHVAAYEGHTSVLAALMRVYPDSWEISDGNGKNLMHLAVEKDRKAVVSLILSRDIVGKSLLMQRDKEGYTPLHLIAKSGHCYKELMEIRGTLDWQVPDNKNFTPLDVLQMTDTEQAKQCYKLSMDQYERDLLSVVDSLMQSISEIDLHLVKPGPCNASCIRFSLVKLLRLSGYDAAVCAAKWQGSGKVPGGDHEYIDVVNYNDVRSSERLIIDIDFRSHFEIARAVDSYDRILNTLPVVYVGSL